MKRIISLTFMFILLCLSGSIAAQQIMMRVEGSKQGVFKGESTSNMFKDFIPLNGFTYDLSQAGASFGTGAAVGRRIKSPLILEKNAGTSSVQFFDALNNNEVITKVTITVYKADAMGSGITIKDFTIELTNVTLGSFKQAIGKTSTNSPGEGNTLQDEIKLNYQGITITHEKSGMSAIQN